MTWRKPGPLLLVEWRDAESAGWWHSEREVEETLRQDVIIRTVGWFVAQDRRFLTLTGRYDEKNESIGLIQRIPLGTVLKKRRLREP